MSASIDTDVATLGKWWSDHSADVGEGVHGLWFGLTDLVGDDGNVRHTMYVAGTRAFDPDDGGDWACDYIWEPEDRYLQLAGFAAIDPRDWLAAVEHAVAVVVAVKPWLTGPRNLQGVGVGFDDGDVKVVWVSRT